MSFTTYLLTPEKRMDTELNHDDLAMLLEGLDAIAAARSSSRAMGSIVGSLLCPPESRDKFKEDQKKEEAEEAVRFRSKQDQLTLLKAKLVLLRQRLDGSVAAHILEDARR